MTDVPRHGGGRPRDGRVVPVYAVTGGRTRAGDHDLPMESLVTVTDRPADDLPPEYREIVALARRPVSVVEVGASVGVPVGVARVLVSDLAASGHLVVHAPPPRSHEPGSEHETPSPQILSRLLEGLTWSLNASSTNSFR